MQYNYVSLLGRPNAIYKIYISFNLFSKAATSLNQSHIGSLTSNEIGLPLKYSYIFKAGELRIDNLKQNESLMKQSIAENLQSQDHHPDTYGLQPVKYILEIQGDRKYLF